MEVGQGERGGYGGDKVAGRWFTVVLFLGNEDDGCAEMCIILIIDFIFLVMKQICSIMTNGWENQNAKRKPMNKN